MNRMKKIGIYLAFALALVVMMAVYPKNSRFDNVYEIGMPWDYETLIADFDFPILKTEQEMLREKEEKSSDVIDCYIYDASVAENAIKSFESAADAGGVSRVLVGIISDDMHDMYETGIVPAVDADSSDEVILVKRGKRMSEENLKNVWSLHDALGRLGEDVKKFDPELNADEILALCSIKTALEPNMWYDEKTTSMFHKEAVDYISPTKGMFYAGQLVVSEGELITPDICEILDSYRAEYEKIHGEDTTGWHYWLGTFCCVVVFLGIMLTMMYAGDSSILSDIRQTSLALTLFLIAFVSASLFVRYGSSYWMFILPFAAHAVYLSSFFNRNSAMLMYVAVVLPLILVPEYGITLFICNLASGVVVFLTSEWLNSGWKQFLNAVFVFVVMFLIVFSIYWLTSMSPDMETIKVTVAVLAINSVLVVVCYPFIFIFEKVFSQLSYAHLWILTDTNNKLLSRLAHLAPGTFQHSMQVANMAEAAVREIGGNSMLARVGGLYHDIGKIDNPQCFVENQLPGADDDFHKKLSPDESAREIIRHVEDGIALAGKNSLPDIVTDFIRTHHGSTLTGYFYSKYCNAGGDASNKAPFMYSSGLPRTREHVVLMLADSIEASSRTLKSYSPDNISALVDGIFDERLKGRQFDESDISMKEIGALRNFFKTYLQQVYHARISYPKRRK